MNFPYKFLIALIFVLYVSRVANAQDDLNELDDDNDTTFDLDDEATESLDVSAFSTTGSLESTLLTETTDLTLDTEATDSGELSTLAATDGDSDDDDEDLSVTEGTDSDEDDDDASLDDSTAETDDLEDSDEEESDDGTEVLSETDSQTNDDGDDLSSADFDDIEEECASLGSEQECRDDIADNGDRLCAFSDDDGCYAIVRRAGVNGDGSFDQGFEQALAAGQSESNALYAAIGIMAGVISALVAVVAFGGYRYYQKTAKGDHLTAVELMEQGNIVELDEAAVPIYTQGTR